jgi:general secretion pathway protein G
MLNLRVWHSARISTRTPKRPAIGRVIPKQGNSMTGHRRCEGFTLIEVLLVVVIMAVLAGAVIPRYLGTAEDAKQSALNHNLHVLEVQVELYRAQHLNRYPTIKDDGLPQLIGATNDAGEIGEPGPKYSFGPYIFDTPANPFDGSKKVAAVAVPGQKPKGVVGKLGGWQYDETTGAVWPNNPEYYSTGSAISSSAIPLDAGSVQESELAPTR